MNEILSGLGIGITGGLVTTLFVVVIRKFWLAVVVPWYENSVYKDADIRGDWGSKYGLDACGEEAISIEQSAHKVSGAMTCISGPDKGTVYTFQGEFKNLILTASYTSKSRSTLDRGNFTLMLKNNGSNLIGYTSYYSDEQHEVLSSVYEWSKSP